MREYNAACLSQSVKDDIERLVFEYADMTPLLEHLMLPGYAKQCKDWKASTDKYGITRPTYWQDGTLRSEHRLYADPGRFWKLGKYDRRSREHQPLKEWRKVMGR